MHALVCDIAVPRVPEPVPVVMKPIGIERAHGRRPQPGVEIHRGGRLRIRLAPNAFAALVAEPFRHTHFDDCALAHMPIASL